MVPDLKKEAPLYRKLWATMVVDPLHEKRAAEVASKILQHLSDYQLVEKMTGVPWHMIACIHYREDDLNFEAHLANGDPLGRPTTHVPRGLLARTWSGGAVQAVDHEGWQHVTGWDQFGSCAYYTEEYNGWGYHRKGLTSSYLWAGSNKHLKGKFTSDGHYSPITVDEQLGTMVVLHALLQNPDCPIVRFSDLSPPSPSVWQRLKAAVTPTIGID